MSEEEERRMDAHEKHPQAQVTLLLPESSYVWYTNRGQLADMRGCVQSS